MNYWLIKSEPSSFSIDDLKRLHQSPWDGVRNYQARNFMQQMKKEDQILFYHSSCSPAGIVGTAKVCNEAYPDYTSWDINSSYYDPKSTQESPRWYMVDISFMTKWPHMVTLAELKNTTELQDMPLTKKGSRLSIMPISESEWHCIHHLAKHLIEKE